MGSPERPVGEDVCEAKAGTEADVEDENVDVVGGLVVVGVHKYASEGFTPSKILRRKKLLNRNVSEGVVDTCHLP